MDDDPDSENASREQPSEDQQSDSAGNPLGAIVDPLTRLSIDTVRDIATAVQSTRTAGRDVLKAMNIFSRIPGRTPAAPIAELPSAWDDPADKDEHTTTHSDSVQPIPARRALSGRAQKKPHRHDSDEDLRRQGNELIAKSQKPTDKPTHRHPAFEQILKQLAPDEIRIMRFLAVAGVQPTIDIRTKTMFQVGSERLASDINMIAEMAGCRWPENDEAYLANLTRLGLVRLSPEPVADYRRYALLEVQPRALEVIETAANAISIYRSIYLSKFGVQFCDVCIDTEGYNAGGWATDERGDKIIGKGPPDPAARKHKH